MSSEQQPPIVEADPRGDLTLNVGNPSDDPSSSRCFLVCSRTLARISPVFDRMLYGAFAESRGKHTAEAAWTVDLPEDPPFAFTIFVTISHGFVSQSAPFSISRRAVRPDCLDTLLRCHAHPRPMGLQMDRLPSRTQSRLSYPSRKASMDQLGARPRPPL